MGWRGLGKKEKWLKEPAKFRELWGECAMPDRRASTTQYENCRQQNRMLQPMPYHDVWRTISVIHTVAKGTWSVTGAIYEEIGAPAE